MLPTDSIVETADQQPGRWTDCKVPGARLYTATRDVEACDGTQITRDNLIVITERYTSCAMLICTLSYVLRAAQLLC